VAADIIGFSPTTYAPASLISRAGDGARYEAQALLAASPLAGRAVVFTGGLRSMTR
jgi:hypothetical protein